MGGGETHSEASGSGPDAVALAVEDGSLVNVASADEAGGRLSVMVLQILTVAVCTSGRRMLLFQKSADKLAISMREERKGLTLPRHYCGCEVVCRRVGGVEVGCARAVEILEMEIIEWFVSKMALSPGIDC